ncbi:MAG TPA: ABC transporter permease [Spirochaetota bacterium]|nr:MAG: putative phospholipid ABC transporter permease protein MlaE [Spirochaetes bacterium ADurb.Bin133]HNZ27574.1 ABC transporter permease [Spirochaetota bacterium]HOF01132.1 ABC transporter permease [Spirochaetota bacterium]HOS32211.1 ABC transporter permease [Spirochaetota bacterium]HOS55644.1 ABC transporter permease [Spirochaetota bacterium]
MRKFLENFSDNFKTKIDRITYFSGFFKLVIVELALFPKRKQVTATVLIRQILFTGFEALKLVSLIGLTIGGIIIIQGMGLLENFGQSDLVYTILIMVITKELGPIITAIILIARSGTAISTELGNMVVNHEVEALYSFGVNPISYLIIPRILGVMISFFALSIYMNLAGLLGGYLVANIFSPFSFIEFGTKLMQKLTVKDAVVSQIKSLVFGFIIAIISCYQGLSVNYASTEVPQKTIKAVVSSLSWIIIFDILIALIYYSI